MRCLSLPNCIIPFEKKTGSHILHMTLCSLNQLQYQLQPLFFSVAL